MSLRALYNPYCMQGADEAVRELLERQDAPSQALLKAFRRFFERSVTPGEKEYLARIRQLRTRLNASTDLISQMDYGAGHADSATVRDMIQGHSNNVTVGKICRSASVTPLWGFLLFTLIREFKPQNCLELGTSLGVSTAYEAAALRLNGSGHILTLEGSPALAARAEKNIAEVGLEAQIVTGRFSETLPGILQSCGPVDYAFIDGHHDEHATLEYFQSIAARLSPTSILVFDDISWSAGMRRAWDVIAADPRVKIGVDFSKLGVCVIAAPATPKYQLRCSLTPWQKTLLRTPLGEVA